MIVFVYQERYMGSGALVTLNYVLTLVEVTKNFSNDISNVHAFYGIAELNIPSYKSITSISNVIHNDDFKIVKVNTSTQDKRLWTYIKFIIYHYNFIIYNYL